MRRAPRCRATTTTTPTTPSLRLDDGDGNRETVSAPRESAETMTRVCMAAHLHTRRHKRTPLLRTTRSLSLSTPLVCPCVLSRSLSEHQGESERDELLIGLEVKRASKSLAITSEQYVPSIHAPLIGHASAHTHERNARTGTSVVLVAASTLHPFPRPPFPVLRSHEVMRVDDRGDEHQNKLSTAAVVQRETPHRH